MPFVSRKEIRELRESKEKVDALLLDNEAYSNRADARDEELNEIGGFLRFLAVRVPDYEGYVLEYLDFMEDQENAGN